MAAGNVSIEELGPRICILGPSNSGKSTLANAIARAHGMKAVHLDVLRFLPNTDWEMRPAEEFTAMHDEAIRGESWVMDGNFSKQLPQRLERATGVILIEIPILTSLWRYFRRTWFEKDRVGGLGRDSRDTIKWEMIHWIVVGTPAKNDEQLKMFDDLKMAKLKLASQRDIDTFYEREKLTR